MKNLTRCVNQGNMDMKFKYLTLALAAAMATTGLTACGGDDNSNYSDPVTDPVDETDPTDPVDATDPTDPTDNAGDAAEAFDISKKSSVVGQNYIRGSSSDFDKSPDTNVKGTDNGNSTVLGAETLQNKKMTNIVVAQYDDVSVTDAEGNANNVKYILGEKPKATPDVNALDSIQTNNDASHASGTLSPFIMVTKDIDDKLVSTGQESKVDSKNSKFTQTGTAFVASTDTDNDARVYGKLSNKNNTLNNSSRYIYNDTNTVDLGTNSQFKVTPIKLNHVQYGRVTGNLEGVTADTIAGRSYIQADFANKNFNGNTTQTDIYFYRGLSQTAIAAMPKSGTFEYAGHALMYGIDNSYTGEDANGQSNSVAFGANAEAIGNFVNATYDADNKTVDGSIYNVWNMDTDKTEVKSVSLVAFGGDVIGNTIKGNANLTYDEANTASFKGSFYGHNAKEMGGSFNSISDKYGKAEWGGVFGAKQIDKPATGPVFIPPINAVE